MYSLLFPSENKGHSEMGAFYFKKGGLFSAGCRSPVLFPFSHHFWSSFLLFLSELLIGMRVCYSQIKWVVVIWVVIDVVYNLTFVSQYTKTISNQSVDTCFTMVRYIYQGVRMLLASVLRSDVLLKYIALVDNIYAA